jgi:regulator of replication initiation timing
VPDKDTETSLKTAKWKVIGTIIVALIGVYGSVLATWMTSKTSDTGDALQATVEQLNTQVIPSIQQLVSDLKVEIRILREENKDLNKQNSNLRERLARVETIVDPPMTPSKPGFLKRLMENEEGPALVEITAPPLEEEDQKIPQLNIQQLK